MKTYLAVYDVEGDVCVALVDLSDEQYYDLLDHASVSKLIPLDYISVLPKTGYCDLKDLDDDMDEEDSEDEEG